MAFLIAELSKISIKNGSEDLLIFQIPKGCHEKICWIKLYAMTPLHAYCSDKITAPAYIYSVLGEERTARRYFATYDVRKIVPEGIPTRSCVIKSGHDYNGVFVIPDVSAQDWPSLRDKLGKRLDRNFYYAGRERQYRYLRPGILVEEFLGSQENHSSG